MDVQQLTHPATGTTAWSLRDQAGPAGSGPLDDAPPWWVVDGSDPVITTPPVGGERESRSVSRVLIGAGAVLALILCLEAVVAMLVGMRWFVVETPSMGTAAPVGSLVITRRAPVQLAPGEIIAFVPPGVPRVYTHRILSIAADGGITTKGDINGAPDGWVIRHGKVLGEAVAIVPGGGYVLRGLPAFLIGAVVVWAATLLIRRRDRRASARIVGLHLVGTLVVLWLHPFVQVVLLTTETVADRVRESIVSTGLLPVKLVDSAGTVLARLSIGQPETVSIPPATRGMDRIVAMPDLGPMLQLLLVGMAFVPAVIVMIVGLPRERDLEVDVEVAT